VVDPPHCLRKGDEHLACAPHGVWHTFYPRDAMLAWVLAMSVRPSVCLSVCHKSVFYRNGWMIRAGFGIGASFCLSYAVLQRNSCTFRNKGTSLWKFAANSGLNKFRHSISIVEACYQHSSRKVDDQGMINWTVIGQLS